MIRFWRRSYNQLLLYCVCVIVGLWWLCEGSEHQAALENASIELSDTQSQLTDLQASMAQQQEELQSHVTTANGRVSELEADLARAQEQQAATSDADDTSAELDRLQEQNAAHVIHAQQLEEQLATLIASSKEREARTQELEGQRQKLEEHLNSTGSDKDAEVASVQDVLAQKESKLAEVSEQLNDALTSIDSYKGIESELDAAEEKVEHLESTLTATENENNEKEAEKKQLNDALEQSRIALEASEQKLEGMEALLDHAKTHAAESTGDLAATLAASEAHVKGLQSDLEAANIDIAELEAQLNEGMERHEQLESTAAKMGDMEKAIADLSAERQRLVTSLEQVRERSKEEVRNLRIDYEGQLDTKEEGLSKWRAQLKTAAAALKSTEERATVDRDTAESARVELEELEESTKSAAKQAKADMKQLKREKEDLQAQLETCKETLTAVQADQHEQQTLVASKEGLLQEAAAAKVGHSTQVAILQKESTDLKKQLNDLRVGGYNTLQSALREQEDQNSKMAMEQGQIKDELAANQLRHEQQVAELEREYEAMEARLHSAESEIEDLTQQLYAASTSLTGARKEYSLCSVRCVCGLVQDGSSLWLWMMGRPVS